jgi:hypothetical protein
MQCCIRGGEVVAQKWDKIRTEYREEGAIAARKQEVLHASACMLYWGEGSKSRYLTQMTNSDPDVHRLFISFLRKYFITRDEDMSIAINCHTDLHTLEEIENYWLCQLGLPRSSLRKGTVNYPLRQLERKKHQHKKCEYGTCALKIKRSIRIVQHIYGALEEYKKGLIVI